MDPYGYGFSYIFEVPAPPRGRIIGRVEDGP